METEKNKKLNEISLKNNSSPASLSSPILWGLKVLESAQENSKNDIISDENMKSHDRGYIPYSTIRARKRADFDSMNETIQRMKSEEERRQLGLEIKRVQKELKDLRQNLR